MFDSLENFLLSYAEQVHLAIFSPVVSFIEEIIPPIPSPSVMIATGTLAAVQEYLFWGLLLLAVLAAVGKTLGALVVYTVADKAEDLLMQKLSKFVNITHAQIESVGKHLGQGPRDYFILTLLRTVPLVPSSLISVGCGVLKVRYKLFFISTFIGSVFRALFYIYVGYIGLEMFISFSHQLETVESFVQLGVLIVVLLVLIWLYIRRQKFLLNK